MKNEKAISAEFPFQSSYIEMHGSQLHYIEEGTGDPVLLLHGNPTSSYVWRNIIPYLSRENRCIAPDLIGMGKSDKPDIPYRFFDHYRYIEGFIQKLELDNLTLVLHDWGSALGFHYAYKNEEKVRALAFMEAMVKPLKWEEFSKDFKLGFKMIRTPVIGWLMVSVMNMFVNQIMPKATLRELSEKERDVYREPFPSISSRKPVRQWPLEIPIDGSPQDMHNLISEYSDWLQKTDLPKLLLYADPGGIINQTNREWCRTNMKNLKMADIGKGIHYIQEDHPREIGEELAQWIRNLKNSRAHRS